MADKFLGFWMKVRGERGEGYLLPATSHEVANQLRKMGYVVPPGEEKNWSPIPVAEESDSDDKKFKKAAVSAFAGLINNPKAGG